MDLLMELNKEGTTMAIVIHDNEVSKKTNQVIHMLDGNLI